MTTTLTRLRGLAAIACCALASACGTLPAASDDARLLHTDHPLVGRVWDMQQGRAVDAATLPQRLRDAEVLLLGETHDNPEHHRLQLQLLQARLAGGGTPALAMEQFDIERQPAIDGAIAGGDADALAAAAGFAKSWGWEYYRPLVATALQRKLPLIAANTSRERIRPVIRGSFDAIAPGELQRLGVEAAWSPGRQAYLVELIEESHCGQIDTTLRDGLVRAQRLRDAAMADVMLRQIDRGVVAILGRGHARRDIAVPRYLEVRRPGTRTLTIGFVEVSPDRTAPEDYERERADGVAPYDLLWFTARAVRTDPCANFPKRG